MFPALPGQRVTVISWFGNTDKTVDDLTALGVQGVPDWSSWFYATPGGLIVGLPITPFPGPGPDPIPDHVPQPPFQIPEPS